MGTVFLGPRPAEGETSPTGKPARGARPRLPETPAPGPSPHIWWLCLGTATVVLPLLLDLEVSIPPQRVMLCRGWRPADSPACRPPGPVSATSDGWTQLGSVEATRAPRRAWLPQEQLWARR